MCGQFNMHSSSESTEKGTNQVLRPQYNQHGSQQQETIGLERAIPVRGPVQRVEVEITVKTPLLKTEQNCTLDQNAQCIFKAQSTSAQLKASAFHLPWLSRHPSPGINRIDGFPPNKRGTQQNMLDISYGINGGNSGAMLREAIPDIYMIQKLWTQQWRQEKDGRSNALTLHMDTWFLIS